MNLEDIGQVTHSISLIDPLSLSSVETTATAEMPLIKEVAETLVIRACKRFEEEIHRGTGCGCRDI